MAEAIENASVVLMCVSEKYYLSPSCRLEAEYAVKLQKPIIPLIMQQDFTPVGWLGAIIGEWTYQEFKISLVNQDLILYHHSRRQDLLQVWRETAGL